MKTFILISLLISAQLLQSQEQNKNPKLMFHQFDFWLGKWDVFKYGTDTLAGKSEIQTIIDSVGLLENYSSAKSTYVGKSLNKYNPGKNRWEQYWIDNSGLTLFLCGGLVNGKMVLNDRDLGDAKNGLNQIVWEKLKNGSVRQTWSLSKDNGKSWSVLFDGEYKRKKTS